MSLELSVDEMIVATINSSKELDERIRNQMVAWIKCAADFGSEVDKLAEQNRNLEKEKMRASWSYSAERQTYQ